MRRLAPLGVLCALLSVPALAEVSQTDLSVAARALGFLQRPLTGEISVGIVYERGNAQSEHEAQQLAGLMDDGFRAGTLTLHARLVAADELSSARVGLFFLTSGMGRDAAGLAQVSQSRHIPCVTTDIMQVEDGQCAMGVRASPKVEILVNRAAAAASGMSFSSVFRVMITEL